MGSDTARVLKINKNTVISTLKKVELLSLGACRTYQLLSHI